MKRPLAPVILFTYNRLDHTKKTITALQNNVLAKDTALIIYSDGAKNAEAAALVTTLRAYLHSVTGFLSISIIERDTNFGLAASIVDGVSTTLRKHDRVIILEDDIVTSPHFLTYMNDALTLYLDTPEVMHVSGYFFPVNHEVLPETFFYNQTSCWGWGTWARAWQHFSGDAGTLLTAVKKSHRLHEFNMDGSFRFSSTLRANSMGRMSTWAILWHTSVFLKRGLCLHPRLSLTHNIGHDGSGTHGESNDLYNDPNFPPLSPVTVSEQPLVEYLKARKLASAFLKQLKPTLISRLKRLFHI